jgi:ATP-dependent helicase/DNAse subunit B
MRDLRRFHALDTANGLEPLAAELSFGMNGAEPVTLRLKSGREVRFRGRADRVDRKENGSLVVTDYKTGLPAEVDGLEHDWVLRGTKLQLPLYALAAAERFGEHDTAVLSRYWFVSGRAQFAERGYAVDDRVLERFRDVVEAILGEIAAGMFPARPGAPGSSKSRSNCKYCDFDSICAIDRERQWAAKHADARLAPYLELCGDAEAPDPALDVKRR